MNNTPEFPCTQCGACCRHVHRAEETQYLDRGDGVCRHYDDDSKLCLIYETRPLICQVDKQYELNYRDKFSWETFIEINKEACIVLEKL